jgi:hypothetical protein
MITRFVLHARKGDSDAKFDDFAATTGRRSDSGSRHPALPEQFE